MQLWFAKRMKECPRCQSSQVRRSRRRGFQERVVHRLLFVWPYQCRECNIRFIGFQPSYARQYSKPRFELVHE
jgi:transposase-like protein